MVNFIKIDNTTIKVPVLKKIKCPRCLIVLRNIRSLRYHAKKVCTGPKITVQPASSSNESGTWIKLPHCHDSFGIHQELGVIICYLCRTGVLLTDVSSHYRKHYPKVAPLNVESLFANLDVVPANPRDSNLEEFYCRPFVPKIPGLPYYEDAVRCELCSAFFTTKRSFKTHHARFHISESPLFTRGYTIQTFYRKPTYLRYFAVDKLEVNDIAIATDRCDTGAVPHPRELSIIDRATGWGRQLEIIFDGMSRTEMKELCDVTTIREEETRKFYETVSSDIFEYLKDANKKIPELSYFFRKELIKKSQFSEPCTKGMRALQNITSLRKYSKTLVKVLKFCHQFTGVSLNVHTNLTKYSEMVGSSTASERRIRLHNFFVSLFCQKKALSAYPGNFEITIFVMVNSLTKHGKFEIPQKITQFIAHIVFALRCMVIIQNLNERYLFAKKGWEFNGIYQGG
jgi:uncharacterized C2H2 Zn-finger protein